MDLTTEYIDWINCEDSDDNDEYGFVVTNAGDDHIDIALLPKGLDESECTEIVKMSCDWEGCDLESNKALN